MTIIKNKHQEWLALRMAMETCAMAQGVALVATMATIEATVAATTGHGLCDVLIKLEMAMAGVEGMVESAYADLAPCMAQAAE